MNPLEAMKYFVIMTCRKTLNQYKLCNRKRIVYGYRKARKCLAKIRTIAQNKLSEDETDSSKQLILAENKISKFNLEF
jgi:hypothetical protein